MNCTWTSITLWPCQSYTHPIRPWDVPTLDIGYGISEHWIVTVQGILQGGDQSCPSGIVPRSLETPSPWYYRIHPPRTDPYIP